MASRSLLRLKPAAAGVITTGAGLYILKSYFTSNAFAESPNPEPAPMFSRKFGTSLKLQSAELVNHNTKRLRFEFPNDEQRSGLALCSAVLVVAWPQGRLFPVIRPYTPISPLDQRGHLDLLVKKYPSGKASGYLHSLAPQKDSLYFLASLSSYKWKPNAHPHITLIAGGAGITPIYQLIQGILNNPEDKTAITLVFGVNSNQDILLKSEFEEYERTFPGRFKAVYTVSDLREESEYRKGRITKALLEELRLGGGGNGKEEKVFVCGPPAMEDALLGTKKGPWRKGGILAELGYESGQVQQF